MFAERVALVSKQLFLDQEDNKLTLDNIRLANDLGAEFLHFSNYWYFDELANKDEEIEHFTLQCQEYRVVPMKAQVEQEIEKMNSSLHTHYQFRNTEAVNRLAVVSLVIGAGAVLTGFFGMNLHLPWSNNPHGAWYASALMALSIAVVLFYFKRKRWF
jgi:Mg2+ and Co2+ transporter CorA